MINGSPMEMSTKRAVGRFRQVVEVEARKGRDPRFDPLCGRLDTNRFEKTYSFLEEYRTDEMRTVGEQLKKCRDPVEKTRLHQLLSQMVF
jgi:ribosomal RNA-processing protein 36